MDVYIFVFSFMHAQYMYNIHTVYLIFYTYLHTLYMYTIQNVLSGIAIQRFFLHFLSSFFQLKHNRMGILCVTFYKKWKVFVRLHVMYLTPSMPFYKGWYQVYFYPPKMVLVPPDITECCIRYSWDLFKF
jgi:hypothetical protein